jgi:hypothetical protein
MRQNQVKTVYLFANSFINSFWSSLALNSSRISLFQPVLYEILSFEAINQQPAGFFLSPAENFSGFQNVKKNAGTQRNRFFLHTCLKILACAYPPPF